MHVAKTKTPCYNYTSTFCASHDPGTFVKNERIKCMHPLLRLRESTKQHTFNVNVYMQFPQEVSARNIFICIRTVEIIQNAHGRAVK